ncbi:hypothetical protein VCV18_005108 [Metarhizium anisopliae]
MRPRQQIWLGLGGGSRLYRDRDVRRDPADTTADRSAENTKKPRLYHARVGRERLSICPLPFPIFRRDLPTRAVESRRTVAGDRFFAASIV